jgi:ABC-type dipeptide/oligopeptide/nickel transport system permease component
MTLPSGDLTRQGVFLILVFSLKVKPLPFSAGVCILEFIKLNLMDPMYILAYILHMFILSLVITLSSHSNKKMEKLLDTQNKLLAKMAKAQGISEEDILRSFGYEDKKKKKTPAQNLS